MILTVIHLDKNSRENKRIIFIVPFCDCELYAFYLCWNFFLLFYLFYIENSLIVMIFIRLERKIDESFNLVIK